MSPAFVPRLGVDATAAVVAHETGHTLTLRHTNILNTVTMPLGPPPACYNIAKDDLTDWPFPNNEIQDYVGNGAITLEWGYDVASQAVLDPTQTFELMSYCSPRWISPLNYTTILSVLGGGPVTLPSVVRASPVRDSAAPPKTPELVPLTSGSYTQVSGTVGSSGVTFNPLFTNTINGTTDPGSGTYSIVVENSVGQPIYTRYFTPYDVETDIATGPDLSFDPVFSEWIPNVAGAASIVVHDPNGATIGSLTLTGTAPSVTLISPGAGFTATGPQPVTWTVSPACAVCTARILYSSNDGATWSQIGEIQGSDTVMINFSGLPGSTAGGSLIQVLVSDGINTGSATSALFSVAKSPPTTIQIDSPQPGYAQAAADTIQLIGEAYDPDDGMLHGSHLVWSSNVQGNLGSGSPLAAKLQAGAHTIIIRPGMVFGQRRGIPAMLLASAHDGAVEYVGDGNNRWPLVYVDDLAELYALALENAPTGVVYNATGPNVERVRDVAAGVAKSLGLSQTKSIPLETARQQLGPFADALCLDQVVSSAKARTQMHWAPSNYTIYEDLGLKA